MTLIEKRLAKMGIELPSSPSPIATYVSAVRTGSLLYLSGVGPTSRPDGTIPTEKLGRDLDVAEGYEAARLTGLNILARLKNELGDLDRVVRVVKVLSMVNSTSDFLESPEVPNGFSDLMVEVFGNKGRHARSAVGMNTLPNNMPVEIEIIAEVCD